MTIGLIPCAGQATRIQKLPKFLLPVPGGYLLKVLHQRMVEAGAEQVYIGTNSENWDLVDRYLPKGATLYCIDSATMSETVLAAREYIDVDQDVIFGMPDTYWNFPHQFEPLGNHSWADVAVGLWYTEPVDRPKRGMCEVDGRRVVRVVDKPERSPLTEGWGILRWRPSFWPYIQPDMPHVGYALNPAIDAGLVVDAVRLGGLFFDCGTADDYFACIRATTAVTV